MNATRPVAWATGGVWFTGRKYEVPPEPSEPSGTPGCFRRKLGLLLMWKAIPHVATSQNSYTQCHWQQVIVTRFPSPPMSIYMLCQQINSQSIMPRQFWHLVQSLHGRWLHTQLVYIVEDMRSSIPDSESAIRRHLQWWEKCIHVLPVYKQWGLYQNY